MTTCATAQATPGEIEARQLSAARLRLGLWLAAEPGRTWDWGVGSVHFVSLYEVRPLFDPDAYFDLDDYEPIEGQGPTLAAAILDAIAKVAE